MQTRDPAGPAMNYNPPCVAGCFAEWRTPDSRNAAGKDVNHTTNGAKQ